MILLLVAKILQIHDKNIQKCFEILSENNLTISPWKCLISKPEVPFYRSKLSPDGIKLTDNKLNTILNLSTTSVKHFRSFLGLIKIIRKRNPSKTYT